MTPHVSVVMPVRDGARWLGEALESVAAQSFADWELIVIDDGSSDETPSILDRFARRERRMVRFRQKSLGLVAALNLGLEQARAPLIARLDADDRARPARFARQVAHLSAHPEIGLLGSWADEIDENGRPRGQLKPPTDANDLARLLATANPMIHSSVMVRTELVRRLGGFRAAFRAAEDYDLWLRLAEIAQVANLPEPLIEYRWHSANVTRRNAIRQAFSVRLAQRSAHARRESGRDPAEELTAPPEWRAFSADASFYASDASLYRMLDLADPGIAARLADSADFTPLAARFGELNHAERALAAQAMIHHMMHAERTLARQTRSVFLRLLLRHPGMVPRSALGSLPRALLR